MVERENVLRERMSETERQVNERERQRARETKRQ